VANEWTWRRPTAKASDTLLILLASWNWAELAKRSSGERVGADHLRDLIGLVATQLLSSNAITFTSARWMQAILQISLVAPLFFDLKPVVIMSHLTRQTCQNHNSHSDTGTSS
jgi:hypothetical protein